MDKLTERQAEVLDVIVQRQSVLGYPPTIRELCEALDVTSTNTVSDHLAALERKGCIERQPGMARGIRVVADPATRWPVDIVIRENGVVVSVSRGSDRREALLRLLDGELCREAIGETRRARGGIRACCRCGEGDARCECGGAA